MIQRAMFCPILLHFASLRGASHPAAPMHSTYRTEVARARRGVEAQQQSGDGDHVVLHKRLQEGRKCQPWYVPAGSRAPSASPTW